MLAEETKMLNARQESRKDIVADPKFLVDTGRMAGYFLGQERVEFDDQFPDIS